MLDNPVPVDRAEAADFDLVFYPGGHGPMEDLAYYPICQSSCSPPSCSASGRPLALLYHAPAAINAATGPDGTSPFAGYRMTGLSNHEGLLRLNRPRRHHGLLEDRLKALGVACTKAILSLRPHVEWTATSRPVRTQCPLRHSPTDWSPTLTHADLLSGAGTPRLAKPGETVPVVLPTNRR